jgi:hypothetical protein
MPTSTTTKMSERVARIHEMASYLRMSVASFVSNYRQEPFFKDVFHVNKEDFLKNIERKFN